MTRFLLILILLFPIAVLAQDEEADILIPEEPQTVSITADSRKSITFTVDEFALYVRLSVESLSEEFDPVVWIVDSSHRLIAYNDSVDEETHAQIDNLYLLPDSYTIFVDSFNGVSEGDVIVSLEIVDPFNTEFSSSEIDIVINIFLPEDTVFAYDFPAKADDIITVTVRDVSGSLDPYLAIYDESDNLLIANDDHQSTDLSLNLFDSRITEWDVPADGHYRIEVHDFSGNSGQFELTITIQP